MNTIDQTNWKGKKALVRVDLNVPLDGGHRIMDYTRIESSMPTIEHILDQDGSVILMSHLGRPKGKLNDDLSLRYLVPELQKRLKREVKFASDCIGKVAQDMARHLKNGEVLLLENLRFHPEEMEGNARFASELASLGDAYVNDAFGASHRHHASITEVPEYFKEKYGGELMELELEKINLALEKPREPVTAVIGGAKVADKIGAIAALLEKADQILIGGAMAYTFVKAQDGDTGDSPVENEKVATARWLLNKSKRHRATIVLPGDSLVAETKNPENTEVMESRRIKKGWSGKDIGPEARKYYAEVLRSSKTILWNGPMGVFEDEKFDTGTREVAQALADATDHDAYTLAGGGDTTAAIAKFMLQGSFWHVSTGGGALLEYLENRDLPGIHALEMQQELVF